MEYVFNSMAALLAYPLPLLLANSTSSRDDGGILWVFSSCGASVGFLTRYDGELREPLMWRQGSQVSMRMARGSVSLLSSHGRGIRPQDALKTDS